MRAIAKILALSCSPAFSSGLIPFASNSPAKASEVNQNFQYLDTSKAAKLDVELIKSALGGKAAVGAVGDLAVRHDSLLSAAKGFADQTTTTKALASKADSLAVTKALRDSTAALRTAIAIVPAVDTSAKRRIDSLAQASKSAGAVTAKSVVDTAASIRGALAGKVDKSALTPGSIGALPASDASHKGTFTTGGLQVNSMVRMTGSDGAEPAFRLVRTDAPVGNQVWDWTTDKANGSLFLRTIQDDEKGSGWAMKIDRKGLTPTGIGLFASTSISGDLDVQGNVLTSSVTRIDGKGNAGFPSLNAGRAVVEPSPLGSPLSIYPTGSSFNEGPEVFPAPNGFNGVFLRGDEKDAAGTIALARSPEGDFLISFFGLGGMVGTRQSGVPLSIDAKGNTHIGASLDVGGKMFASSLSVTDLQVAGNLVTRPTTPWADYVFEPGYQPMPLKEIEAYAKQHKHLPEVPSTADVQKDGIDIAKMNAILLKKVEELTLHAVEQEKKMEALQAEVREMKAAVQVR